MDEMNEFIKYNNIMHIMMKQEINMTKDMCLTLLENITWGCEFTASVFCQNVCESEGHLCRLLRMTA